MLSGFDLSRAVDSQARNGRTPARSQTFNLPGLFDNREVLVPRVKARVEKAHLLPRQLVYGPDVIGFVEITRATGQGEIIFGRFASVCLRRDVFDFKRQVENNFRRAAVFAVVAGASGDERIMRIHVLSSWAVEYASNHPFFIFNS